MFEMPCGDSSDKQDQKLTTMLTAYFSLPIDVITCAFEGYKPYA